MNPPLHCSSTPTLQDSPPALASHALRVLRFALKRRRRGKIAALPDAIREQINRMLDDGLTYSQIIASLGETGKRLSEDSLSRWRKTGFQDWCEARLQTEALGARATQPDQATSDLRTLLMEFDPVSVGPILARDPAKIAPLIKAIVRIFEACCEAATDPRQTTPNHAKPHQIADKFSVAPQADACGSSGPS